LKAEVFLQRVVWFSVVQTSEQCELCKEAINMMKSYITKKSTKVYMFCIHTLVIVFKVERSTMGTNSIIYILF
jgi:hypothetical protein